MILLTLAVIAVTSTIAMDALSDPVDGYTYALAAMFCAGAWILIGAQIVGRS